MKKMIVLLAAMMMAMSVSAWATDAAPAKADAAIPAKVETTKKVSAPADTAKSAKKHSKSKEKMRGGQNHPDYGCNDGWHVVKGRATCGISR